MKSIWISEDGVWLIDLALVAFVVRSVDDKDNVIFRVWLRGGLGAGDAWHLPEVHGADLVTTLAEFRNVAHSLL